MKWLAIISFAVVVGVFYLMGDRPEQPVTAPGDSVRYQDDAGDEFEDDTVDGPSWQNKRAEKVMPLGSNLQ